MQVCPALGWQVRNDDARALWSYACSIIDPRQALNLVPLLNNVLIGEVG